MASITVLGAIKAFSTASTVLGLFTQDSAAKDQARLERRAGENAKIEADFRQRQLDQKAGQERAKGQRRAAEIRRQARLRESRAVAIAASGGGGVDGINNLLAGISGQGEFEAGTALYDAEERARSDELTGETIAYGGYQDYLGAKAKSKGTLLAGRSRFISGAAGLAKGFAEKYAPVSAA